MTVGKRNAALCALISLLIVTLMSVSLTQGRYSKELTSGSEYSGSLEYIVSEQVEINSVDEFFSAIENGYSNIKVSDDVDNPLIITGSVSDVNSDLTIDLNGHELQRNNREPMLNVTEGVRLTIIDTSEKQTGSFYNPVGSVLRISGGTLTVAAGLFESGPRDGENLAGDSAVYSSEYASREGGVWRNKAGAEISGTASVAYYEKNDGGYIERQENMPVIIPAVTNVGSAPSDGGTPQHSINGNFYFDADASSIEISKDAYLYFTVSDGSVSNSLIAADNGSADFYYTYTLYRSFDDSGVVYSAAFSGGAEEIEVTVYGYNDVMSAAQSAATYAAIQMNSGNLYVRGGDYVSYFGNDSTYCVYATGGYMAVENGVGSFQAHGAGKCVSISYGSVSEDEYLRVASGDFYSQTGDTIAVSGGLMRVSGDVSFTKKITAEFASSQDNGSAISMTGGELYVSSTSSAIGFNLTGNYMNGISVSGGTLSVTGSAQNKIIFTIAGSSTRGISSEVSGGAAGSVTVSDAVFNISKSGDDSNGIYGIYSGGGTITATNCLFDMVGSYARGIYSAGGTVKCGGSTVINVNGTYSAGILADGGDINVSGMYKSEITNCVAVIEANGNVSNSLSSTAISSEGGNISIAGGSATITTDGLGITARSGASINISTTTFTLTSNNGTAIYINGGSLTIGENTTDEETTAYIKSTINEDYGWVTPPDEEGNQAGGNANVNKYNGVYIQGGSLTANGTFNVTHTGVATDNEEVEHEANWWGGYNHDGRGEGDALITSFEIKSFAVRVEGGDGTEVVIDQGNITNDVGGGLYVSGGKVTLGKDSSADDIKISTTGNELHVNSLNKVDSGFIPTTMGGNWQYKLNKTGGPAIQVNGGEITVYNGTYTAEQGDGLRVNGGTANIYGGVFAGNDHGYDEKEDATRAGPAASYAFKMQGGTANIYGGAFGTQNGTSKHDGSGAFVMGTAADAKGVAKIYGGTFEVKGQAGFSVYQYADVTFNQRGGENDEGGDILVSGTAAGMTVESASGGSTIEIMSGTFRSTRAEDGDGSGIWYSNANATLTIKGGNFEGSQRSGLYFAVNPGNSVQISGGTFTTKSTTNNAISGVDITYGSILSDLPAARAEVTYGNNSNSTYASDANTYITYVIEEGAWYDRTYYYAHTVNVFHD